MSLPPNRFNFTLPALTFTPRHPSLLTKYYYINEALYGIADKLRSELIGHRLHEQPEDSFVTLYWLKAVLGGDNLCGRENALSVPPEQNKLDGFLQAASGILDQDVNSCNDVEKDQLQQALATTITGATSTQGSNQAGQILDCLFGAVATHWSP